MNQETLQELFVKCIRDMYDAEKQITKALPKMVKAAESEELQDALRNHLEETQNQVGRLEQVFQTVGAPAKGKPCKGMKGLIEEGNEAIQEEDEGVLRDLTIIASAQKVEHYEIAAYGTARTIAEQMGNDQAVELLQQTEEEEENADETLTRVAMSLYESSQEEEEEEEKTQTASAGSRGRARSAGASGGRGPTKRARGASR